MSDAAVFHRFLTGYSAVISVFSAEETRLLKTPLINGENGENGRIPSRRLQPVYPPFFARYLRRASRRNPLFEKPHFKRRKR